jgi:hypothetical protein
MIPWFVIGMVVFALFFLLLFIRKLRREMGRVEPRILLLAVMALTTPIVSTYLNVTTSTQSYLYFLKDVFGQNGMRIVICAFFVAFGAVAHIWKKWDIYSFGISEVVFGCIAAWFITFRITPGQPLLSQWVGLGGTAYIIARGLNNIEQSPDTWLSIFIRERGSRNIPTKRTRR